MAQGRAGSPPNFLAWPSWFSYIKVNCCVVGLEILSVRKAGGCGNMPSAVLWPNAWSSSLRVRLCLLFLPHCSLVNCVFVSAHECSCKLWVCMCVQCELCKVASCDIVQFWHVDWCLPYMENEEASMSLWLVGGRGGTRFLIWYFFLQSDNSTMLFKTNKKWGISINLPSWICVIVTFLRPLRKQCGKRKTYFWAVFVHW